MARSTKARKDSLVIEAPAESIMKVLLDYGSYPEWMGNVVECEVLETDSKDRPSKVRFRVDVFLDKIDYALSYTYSKNGFIGTLVEGDLEDCRGGYTLKPLDDGTTEVTYKFSIEYELPNFLKGAMMKNMIAQIEERVVKSALADLKNKVEYL